MKKTIILTVLLMLAVACGGEDDSGGTGSVEEGTGTGETVAPEPPADSGSSGSGEVVDPPPPGQATASVDGNDYSFEVIGPVGCSVSDSEINFGFIIGDNDVNVVGGGTSSGSDWRGRIDISVQESDGIANYFAELADGSVATDGASMSYTGPWQLLPPGGSEAESAGDGAISVTCA